MIKYTQLELCSEGFWNGVANVAKGVGHVIDTVAPEAAQPFKQIYHGYKNLNQKIIQNTSSVETNIRNGLQQQGYKLVSNISELKNPGKSAYNTRDDDNKRWLVTVQKLMTDPRTRQIVVNSTVNPRTCVVDRRGHIENQATQQTSNPRNINTP